MTTTTRRIQLTSSHLRSLLDFSSAHPQIHALLLSKLPSNIRIVKPPVAEPDHQLTERLNALLSQVNQLSKSITDQRQKATQSFEQALDSAHSDLSNIPTPPPLDNIENFPNYQPTTHVSDQLARALKDTQNTLKRVSHVKTVLCMLDQEDVDDDVSRTIAADWSVTFDDLARATRMSSGGIRKKRKEKMLSPFVTPRSKTRRRVRQNAADDVSRKLYLPR